MSPIRWSVLASRRPLKWAGFPPRNGLGQGPVFRTYFLSSRMAHVDIHSTWNSGATPLSNPLTVGIRSIKNVEENSPSSLVIPNDYSIAGRCGRSDAPGGGPLPHGGRPPVGPPGGPPLPHSGRPRPLGGRGGLPPENGACPTRPNGELLTIPSRWRRRIAC